MPDEFKHDVFLSHSAKDKAVVRAASLSASNGERAGVRCRSLHSFRKDGLKVWPVPPKRRREGGFDEWVLKAGDSIPAKIDPPTLRSYGGTREGLEHSRVLACPAEAPGRWWTCPAVASARRRMLCMAANAFGSDWAQLESGTFRFRDPLNKERRFIPLRLDDAPIKGSLAQFLYINWLPEKREQEYAKLFEACGPTAKPMISDRRAVEYLALELSNEAGPSIDSDNQVTSGVLPRCVGDAWSGLRGLLQQAYSTKLIKGIIGKAGLPIAKIKYTGTFKGPVLDEADKLVSSLSDAGRDQFAVACIQEILALERTKAANPAERGTEPDNQVVQALRVVLARFGHDLTKFES